MAGYYYVDTTFAFFKGEGEEEPTELTKSHLPLPTVETCDTFVNALTVAINGAVTEIDTSGNGLIERSGAYKILLMVRMTILIIS